MTFLGGIAIGYVCIVGVVYSVCLLGDCYLHWKRRARTGDTECDEKAHSRSAWGEWWWQVILASVLLTVAGTLLTTSWQRVRPVAADQANAGVDLVPSVQVPGMLPVPPVKIMRAIDRPRQPILGADLAYIPATDSDIHALAKEGGSIEFLVLTATGITDVGLACLCDMPSLKQLALGKTHITDSGCEELGQMVTLEDLSLSDTAITDDGLRHLSNLTRLESLDVRNTAITDAGLQSLQKLQRLKVLVVGETQVTAHGIRNLKAKLPSLISVRRGSDG